MIITVLVRTKSSKNLVEKIEDNYIVSVTDPPVKGLANKRIIKLLSDYFKVSKSNIKIINGEFSRKKIIEVLDV